MPSADKIKVVDQLREEFQKAKALYVVDFHGMTTEEMLKIRAILSPFTCKFKVVKNTLAARASKDAGIEGLDKFFSGPTAVAIEGSNGVKSGGGAAGKALIEFAKDSEHFKIRGGALGRKLISAGEIKELAGLPSREALLGKLAGALQSPLVTLCTQLSSPLRTLVAVLETIKSKKE